MDNIFFQITTSIDAIKPLEFAEFDKKRNSDNTPELDRWQIQQENPSTSTLLPLLLPFHLAALLSTIDQARSI